MRLRTSLLLIFGFFVVGGMIFIAHERRKYNLVSKEEILSVRKKLHLFSPQEIKNFKHFFNYANSFCQYPYTLVGFKPMSICNYLQESDDLPPVLKADYMRPKHREFADALEEGYKALIKYQNLLPQQSYLIIRYHSSNSKGMKEVALIHPNLCKNEIKANLLDFHDILKDSSDLERVFEILTQPNHIQFYKITQSNRLLGILLGFGRNNALLYEHKRFDRLEGFANEWPGWPRKWRLPGFVCDPSTNETKLLKYHYKKARKYIRWTFFGRNNLEVTLALLAKKSPISVTHEEYGSFGRHSHSLNSSNHSLEQGTATY